MPRKPRPPTEEEFEAWHDLPITRFVMDVYAAMAEMQKQAWLDMSWDGGHANSEALIEFRTRADAYRSMSECELGDLVDVAEKDKLHANV